jgi:diguanylate cyclase (GGDEF)-like protein/PAS domain S-box-containing protein
MDKRLTPARIALLYAVFASLWIFASDKLLMFALSDPNLLLQISLYKGLAFVLITTLLLFLLLRTLVIQTGRAHASNTQETDASKVRNLILVFLSLALIVPVFGFGISRIYTPHIQKAAFDDLAAIAELKGIQVETWIQERRDDADELAENAGVVDRLDQWLNNGDMKARAFMLSRMDSFASKHNYDPVLLHADGSSVMASKEASDPIARKVWLELLPSALSSGKAQRSQLYRDSRGKIRLDFVVPLRVSSPQRIVGIIVLRAPVEQFLFPLIQSWPSASPSAETVLARLDGDQIVYLNDLRHRKDSALSLRLPINTPGIPIAASILSGKPLTIEGTDYRGVRVLAATRPIRGTDWHLAAKVDKDEIMALLREMLFWVSLIAIVAVVVVASAVLMLWRQQQRLHQLNLLARTAEKDKQLKLFYDLPFIGMAISSPNSKAWLYANDHLCDMLGYSREELLKTTWADITYPDDLNSILEQFERMKAGEIEGYTLEKRFIRKDGSPISVNLDIKCTRAADGKVDHIVAMIEDITERKKTEQSLRESETTYRSLFDNMLNGVSHNRMIFRDGEPVDYEYIAVNQAYGRITGMKDVVGKKISELIPGYCEDNPESLQVFGKVAQTGESVRWEHYLDALGKWFAFSIYSPAQGDFVAVSEDITERKRAEESLHQAATVFESSHDGITITDLNANIVAVNRSFQTITGYTEAEVLGKNPNLLHSGRQKKDFYQSMWASIRTSGYWQGELWNRRKNGETYPAWLTISSVQNASGDTTHYVGAFSDLSQLKQSETQLEHLAHYDPLTDLPNRLLVQSHLKHALSHAGRHQLQVGVLYIDLDRFKNVNESLGYLVGDELLVMLTERLTMHMRSEDMLARLGGDEFLLVLEHIEGPEEAAAAARTLIELLSQPFKLSGEQEIFIGASIGISIFPDDSNSADQLIQYADSAMHQAKQQGRSTYLFYTESLTRASGAHLELETRLRHAINTNQLRVYYQPQVDISSGHIIGAEALVRWQDPEHGLIPPANFIPLAEETGLIITIGEWVLKEACLQGVRWIKAGLPFMTMAVNLSPHQFQRINIVDVVSKILRETGFPPDRLELELTESALMQQEENAVKMLHLLRAQDIRLAIDDFGTGYSSLSYLKRFPLDVLKIDKSFVDDIPFHKDDMEIAATIIAMGHTLGFKVMAEGVETKEQLAFLQAKGCDMYQGYLTSPPVPAEEFEILLRSKLGTEGPHLQGK